MAEVILLCGKIAVGKDHICGLSAKKSQRGCIVL